MFSNDGRRYYPALAMMTGASMWGVIWYPMRLLEAGGLVGIWLTLIMYSAVPLCHRSPPPPNLRYHLPAPLGLRHLLQHLRAT